MTELSPQLREQLKQLREATSPSEATRHAVMTKLATKLGPEALGAAWPTAPGAGLAGTSATTTGAAGGMAKIIGLGKVVATGILGIAIGGGAIAVWRASHPAAPQSAPAPAQAPSAPTVSPPAQSPPLPPPLPPPPTTTAELDPMRTPRAVSRVPSRKAPPPAPTPRPSPAPQPAPAVGQGVAAQLVASPLHEELELLQRARTALSQGQREDAMAAISTYRRRFPRGTLAPEVEAIDIFLSCQAGAAEARTRAKAFALQHPHSPMNEPLSDQCKEKE